MVFCGQNTSVVEFHFLKNPPMMFWHTAQALSMVMDDFRIDDLPTTKLIITQCVAYSLYE